MNLKFNQRWTWTNEDVKMILSLAETLPKPLIHICSGVSGIGDIRLDCVKVDSDEMLNRKRWVQKYRNHANILGDMCNLPFRDGAAGCVICDPPYDHKFFDGTGFDELVCEIVRICRPNGNVVFYSPWVITHPTLSIVKIIPQKTGAKRSYMKLLSLHIKSNGQIGDYC